MPTSLWAINSIFQRKNFKAVTSLYSERALDIGVWGSSCENPSKGVVGATSQWGRHLGARHSCPVLPTEWRGGAAAQWHQVKSQIQLGAGVAPPGVMWGVITSLRETSSASISGKPVWASEHPVQLHFWPLVILQPTRTSAPVRPWTESLLSTCIPR